MSDGGNYIKLYRSMLDWEWYGNVNTKVLFLHLLLKANWKEKQWQGITIQRGQLVSSYGKLAEETNLTINEIRTALKHLISTGEVTHKPHNKYGLFTIVNFDSFQEHHIQAPTQSTPKTHPINTLLTTTEEGKEGKKEKKERKEEGKVIETSKDVSCPEPILGPPVISLPLNDKTEYQIFDADIEEWTELYPAVNVMQEIRKMRGWLDGNSNKRKTRKGIRRFINSWLSRAQDAPQPRIYRASETQGGCGDPLLNLINGGALDE